MFCPECGEKNPDDAAYCQECGTKIENPIDISSVVPQMNSQLQMPQNYNQPVMPAQPVQIQPTKLISKTRKFILAEIVVLCLACVCFYNVGKKMYSPEKAAERYFLKAMSGDWEGVYDDFDIVESEFLTKKEFVKAQQDQGSTPINTYKISNIAHYDDSLGTSVDISYRSKGSSDNSDYSVSLNKQADKNFWLFDSWKVDPSSYIYNDYSITVPVQAKVVFDGVELTHNYAVDEDSSMAYYQIPELFIGNYEIKVTQEDMEDIKTVISTDDGGFYIDQMTLKEEVKEKLVQEAGTAMEAIYNAGFSSAPFSQIASLFTEEEETRSNMESAYSDFIYNLGANNETGLKMVDFSNIVGTTSYESVDGNLYVYVTIDYVYTATYTESDWWTGDIVTNTYSDYGSTDFTYVLEAGKWVLMSTSFNTIYY